MRLFKIQRLRKFKKASKATILKSGKGFLGIVIFSLLIYNFLFSFTNILKVFKNTFTQRGFSNEEKIARSWKSIYGVVSLLNKYLDDDAGIMAPPQNRDAWLGNAAVIRYFLYPKKIYAEDLTFFEEHKIDAVIISNSWPDFFLPIEKVYHVPIRSYIDVLNLVIGFDAGHKDKLLDINKGTKLSYLEGVDSTEIVAHNISFRDNIVAEQIDFVIQESGENVWLVAVDQELTPDTLIEGELEVGIKEMGSIVARVQYGNGQFAFFPSQRNKYKNQHEILDIPDIYRRAIEYGSYKGYRGSIRLVGVGVSFGTTTKGPYFSKGIGLIDNAEHDLAVDADSPEEHYLKGLAYYRKGKLTQASQELSLARLLLEDSSSILLKGIVLKHQGDYSAARDLFEEAATEGELWGGVELAKLLGQGNYATYRNILEDIYAQNSANTHLNIELAKLYERMNMKILALKHFMKASKDYPRTATSVEAAHILEDYRNSEFGESELDLSMKAYLDGDFSRSAELLADLYNKKPTDVGLKEQFEKAFLLKNKSFNDEGSLNEDVPSGYREKGKYLTNDVTFSLASFYFPPETEKGLKEGTLIFYWQVLEANRIENPSLRYYLIDQIGSLGNFQPTLGLFVEDRTLNLEFRDSNALIPQIRQIKSAPVDWREGQWYKITISWGEDLIKLYIDGQLVGQVTVKEHIGKQDPKIFFGLAEDKGEGTRFNPNRFNAVGIIDEIELYSYQKRFEKGAEVWK